jgi:hypothetical protein
MEAVATVRSEPAPFGRTGSRLARLRARPQAWSLALSRSRGRHELTPAACWKEQAKSISTFY